MAVKFGGSVSCAPRVILGLLFAMAAGTAQATDLYVGSCGTGTAYTTIAAAIVAASANDTILICPGIYSESVTVNKNNLTLRSSTGNRGDVTITHSGIPLTLSGASPTLKNLTVTSTNNIGISRPWTASASAHLFENLSVTAKEQGISIDVSSTLTFRNLTITSSNNSAILINSGGDGAHVFDGITATGKKYGIYSDRGAASFNNVTASGADNGAIYFGGKYAATLSNVTATSANGRGILLVWSGYTNAFSFSDISISAKEQGFQVDQSGKLTLQRVTVASSNESAIRIEWGADGTHEFDTITATGKKYGIYVSRGAASFRSVTATAEINDALYFGSKYPTVLDTVAATSAGGRGVYVAWGTSTYNDMSLTDVRVDAKEEGILVDQSGKLTLNKITVTSSNKDAIRLNWGASGAHTFSNIDLAAGNGYGLYAAYGLGSVSDFKIVAKNQGIYVVSTYDTTLQRGTVSSSGDDAIVNDSRYAKTFTVKDVSIDANKTGIELTNTSLASIQNVCVNSATDGLTASWNASKVSITGSKFAGYSGYGVNIGSSTSQTAAISGSCFLKTAVPRAYSNSTSHTFNGNYWQGISGGGSYSDGNVRDNATLGSCPVTSCYTGPLPILTIATPSAMTEGNTGTKTLSFTASLSASSGSAVSATYALSDGTATGGASCGTGIDYINTGGTMTIAAGAATANINVTLCGDTTAESDETFTVTLSAPVNATLGTASATGTILDDDPLADWRMDETSWNGTADEVVDSSGNNHHGRARIAAGSTALPTTASGSPAYSSGSQNTCNYGQFDRTSSTVRTYTYVELSSLPVLPTSFTFTAWIRSTNPSAQHQRILVRDDAGNGWGLSLADGTGQAKLRFFNRNIANAGSVTGQGSNPSCGVFCLDTDAVVTANNWHFIAATVDTTGKSITLYVYDAAGTLLARASSAFSGTWQDGTGTAAIGGETSASAEGRQVSWHFLGNIDELQIYRGAMAQTDIQALLTRVRTCPATGPHHLELQHASGTGLTCAASSLTIKACGDALSPCAAYTATTDITGTLTATGATAINWDGTTGGATGAGFVIPTGSSTATKNFQLASAGSVVLGTTGVAPAATSATTCNFGTPACTFTANTAGFIFSNSTTGGTYTIPAQVAGTATATNALYLRAVQTSTTNAAICTPAIISQSNVPVTLSYVCNDPTTCQSGNLVTFNSTAVPSGGGSVNLDFDANGSAPLTVRYDDVGQITLGASKTITPVGGGTAVTLTGNSNAFVVKPYDFALSGIQCSDGTTNPAATTASGAKFCKAGDNFSVSVTARTASGATTKNYGKETSPESVKLTSTLVTGLGLTANPTVGGSFGAFSSGVASGAAFTWEEVGIITLTPSIGDGDYLGAGEVSGMVSGNIGRFYPHHFVLSAPSITPAGGTFSYLDQPFGVAFTLTAVNTSGGTTTNYTSSFAKLAPTNTALWPASTLGATGFALGARNSATDLSARLLLDGTPTGVWTGGVATVAANLKLARPTTASADATWGPYDALDIGSAPRDSDGVTLLTSALDLDANSDSTNERKKLGQTKERFGRLRLLNFYGSELLPPRVEYRAEYWDGNRWATHLLDDAATATTIIAGNIATGGLAVNAPGSQLQLQQGRGVIVFDPAAAGSYDIALNLGATTTDRSCNTSHPATTAGNLPWLRGYWSAPANCGSAAAWAQDPNARIKLGSPKAPYIYLRERY